MRWTLFNGETETGVTIIVMGEGWDDGDMILREETSVGENETYGELSERLAEVGAGVLRKSLDLMVDGDFPRTPQDERRAHYREMALAGEEAFAACQDCPHLQDCPYDWRACDRKAARAKAANREIQRPRSSQNSTFAAYTTG